MEGRLGGVSSAVEHGHKQTTPDDVLDLPPGFRFHPTDEEVITHYLTPKVLNPRFVAAAIAEVDLNKCEPWDMPCRAKIGEKDWYFFCQKDRKYPTGTRTNRATYAGYWKATGKDKEIYKGSGRNLVGMKKTLVFYMGRAPKGSKTNWVMHEFRLEGLFPYRHINKDEWVVCRVFNKTVGGIITTKAAPPGSSPPEAADSAASFIDELLENSSPPPPPLVEPSNIASCSYLKCERDDLAENNHPDRIGHSLIATSQPRNGSMVPGGAAGRGTQYCTANPTLSETLGSLEHSLPGKMCSNFSEGFKFQALPGLSPGYPSLATVSRKEPGMCSEGGAGATLNKETSSAVTAMNESDDLRCGGEGGYYGYLEGSLMDAISDYDVLWNFESIRKS
ncbi:hypothetical protein MLD38_007688 [Melastoma candidum]|uniref:Uncharacterized protein n=1 Tax=Melastoma candidum TaxID=119954 RepID=A0ACB9RRD4_9MYRT|nr:hypothetical protein MLD38_007688 [Melastoma candidum]